jgi:hypothetical protein
MSTFQYVILALAAVLIISSFDLSKVKNFLLGLIPKKKEPKAIDVVKHVEPLQETKVHISETKDMMREIRTVDPTKPKITNLVSEWEDVRDMCVDYDLPTSIDKLDDVYPTFIDLVRKNIVKPIPEQPKCPDKPDQPEKLIPVDIKKEDPVVVEVETKPVVSE